MSGPSGRSGAGPQAEGEVSVRFWAAARAAAGRSEDTVTAGTLEELLRVLGDRHGERLTKVLGYCSYLVDGQPVRDRSTAVPPGSELEVLPPFAGG